VSPLRLNVTRSCEFFAVEIRVEIPVEVAEEGVNLFFVTLEIEQRLAAIEERNRRVEEDKAWERSVVRRAVICVLTYVVVFFYNWSIGGHVPYLTAFVP
jgi:hypothetical protein